MSFETLLYEIDDGVATLTLNRPERHNAFDLRMAEELRDAWQAIKQDPRVRCVIVTGAGERAFCSGVDVADVASGATVQPGKVSRQDAPWLQLTAIQNRCWKPVITAVNGMVVGGGLFFIADSDLILCAEHATFFDTQVKVGLISALEPIGLAKRIPLEAVLRLSLLGGSERMTARAALACGLVSEVLPAADLLPRARALAAMIRAHSPTALARTKQLIWESLDVGLDHALDRAWDVIQDHNAHPDLKEGADAFVNKRRPSWAAYEGE